jgi:hypothetical protein
MMRPLYEWNAKVATVIFLLLMPMLIIYAFLYGGVMDVREQFDGLPRGVCRMWRGEL